MKFKVGDRVRYAAYDSTCIGNVVSFHSKDKQGNVYYSVLFDGDKMPLVTCEDWLELVEETKIDHKEHDAVNHPEWYTSDPSGVECIEITKHRDFCVGNAIKYLWRCGLKKDADKSIKEKEIEDLKKAMWYINAKIDMLTNE